MDRVSDMVTSRVGGPRSSSDVQHPTSRPRLGGVWWAVALGRGLEANKTTRPGPHATPAGPAPARLASGPWPPDAALVPPRQGPSGVRWGARAVPVLPSWPSEVPFWVLLGPSSLVFFWLLAFFWCSEPRRRRRTHTTRSGKSFTFHLTMFDKNHGWG